MRALVSIGLIAVFAAVAVSAACFACAPAAPMTADCCKHHRCPKPAQSPKADCGTPAADSFTVEKLAATSPAAMALEAAAFVPVLLRVAPVPPPADYSPPDLRIFASSLTI